MLTLVSEEVEARSHNATPGRYGGRLALAGGWNEKVSDNEAEDFLRRLRSTAEVDVKNVPHHVHVTAIRLINARMGAFGMLA